MGPAGWAPLWRTLILVLYIFASAFPAHTRSILQQPTGAPEGYEYEGKIKFVSHAKPGLRVAKLDGASEAPSSRAGPGGDLSHRTVMVTSDGHKFTKRLDTDPTSWNVLRAQQREFYPSHSPRGRVLQQVTNQIDDLNCNGCPTSDVRVEVTKTTTQPFSSVGQLLGQLGTSNTGLECTGTLIGPNHVVTAAHCVFDINDSRQYVSSINFSPGLNGNSQPYGVLPWTTVRVLDQFTSQPDYTPVAMNYDFALITLKYAADKTAGYLGLLSGRGVETTNLTTAGYPGDKPSGTMWESQCSGVQIDYTGQGFGNQQCGSTQCANIMSHTCLSSNGQSGSAMWDPNNMIRAILTGKVYTSDNNEYNVGTKVDSFVYNTIAQWYNEDSNTTVLQMAPPGPPAAAVTEATNFIKGINWKSPLALGIIIAVAVSIALILIGVCARYCCRRKARQGRPARRGAGSAPPAGYPVYPVQARAAPAPVAAQGRREAPSAPPVGYPTLVPTASGGYYIDEFGNVVGKSGRILQTSR